MDDKLLKVRSSEVRLLVSAYARAIVDVALDPVRPIEDARPIIDRMVAWVEFAKSTRKTDV